MMFTSMPAERRHKDPKPYFIAETNERVDTSAFGTPGATIIFNPRPEFMRAALLPVNFFLDWARENWTSDPWASSLSSLAAVTQLLEMISGDHPSNWRTELEPAGAYQIEDLLLEVADEDQIPMLLHAGAVLTRIADLVALEGKSYKIG
jgi:hypothetical protein